jgi:hypothetical protein
VLRLRNTVGVEAALSATILLANKITPLYVAVSLALAAMSGILGHRAIGELKEREKEKFDI